MSTYDIAALEALRDRVRDATGPDRELDEAICASLGYRVTRHEYTGAVWVSRPGEMRWSPLPRLSASLDACAALQAELLPGAIREVYAARRFMVNLRALDQNGSLRFNVIVSHDYELCLAWLSAILSALIAMHREAVK